MHNFLFLPAPSTGPADPTGAPHLHLFLVTLPGQGAPWHQALPEREKQKQNTRCEGRETECHLPGLCTPGREGAGSTAHQEEPHGIRAGAAVCGALMCLSELPSEHQPQGQANGLGVLPPRLLTHQTSSLSHHYTEHSKGSNRWPPKVPSIWGI